MNPTFANWPYAKRAAHRGAGLLAPENTLAAMRVGASHGYRMFEFDVKLSADGVAILMHDATLDRTTNGRGRVDALTLGEIARLDAGSWHSAQYAGEGVPTLERVAAWLNANGLMANIEIKPCPGREVQTGTAVALEARALWRDLAVPPLLSSFSEEALAAARAAAPELPRALLMAYLPADWLARCRALDCVALDADHQVLDAQVIADAHAAGLRVACYTVNDAQRAEQLTAWGLDCLITDAVDRIDPA
jgi:glycerophosphoryl diester phosphodiesterase